MPHIIVEYSDNLKIDIGSLLEELHHSIEGKYNVALEKIKTRTRKLKNYVVGKHGPDGQMVHIELKLMPGRSDEAKTDLSGILLNTVRKYVPESDYPNSVVTVEVSELHAPSYRG